MDKEETKLEAEEEKEEEEGEGVEEEEEEETMETMGITTISVSLDPSPRNPWEEGIIPKTILIREHTGEAEETAIEIEIEITIDPLIITRILQEIIIILIIIGTNRETNIRTLPKAKPKTPDDPRKTLPKITKIIKTIKVRAKTRILTEQAIRRLLLRMDKRQMQEAAQEMETGKMQGMELTREVDLPTKAK